MLAPAKINLMLHVVGKRADGYHLLQSLTCFADIGDEITLTPSHDFTLTIDGEFAEALQGHENLISKAANALAQSAGIRPHGRISLKKKLPIGAGLGGGSSDAAAALKLLSAHWHCKIPPALPVQLGSDVPACIIGAPCWMQKTGEDITPLKLLFDLPALLVNPRVHLPTQEVYENLKTPYSEPLSLPKQFTRSRLLDFLRSTSNALEVPAIAMQPVIAEVLHELRKLKGCQLARMSGSGSSCFALFASQEALMAAQQFLRQSHPHWWIKKTILQGNHG
jgi:4-diphosphocytidyl-2-C-methyl-D-erythritol kinase